jgi:hypothetical protein
VKDLGHLFFFVGNRHARPRKRGEGYATPDGASTGVSKPVNGGNDSAHGLLHQRGHPNRIPRLIDGGVAARHPLGGQARAEIRERMEGDPS